jgi:hypothetical protein
MQCLVALMGSNVPRYLSKAVPSEFLDEIQGFNDGAKVVHEKPTA